MTKRENKEIDITNNIIKDMWEKPMTRTILIIGVTTLIIYISGHLMNICAGTIRSYKGLKNAVNQ